MTSGCLLSMQSLSVTSANNAKSHNFILLKTRFFGLHFCRWQYRYIFNYFYVTGAKAAKFCRMTQNNGHYTVCGHSRSTILVPIIESSLCGFLLVINTNLHPISHRSQVILSRLLVKFALSTGGTSL